MKKNYTRMNGDQLASATREFDRERPPRFRAPPRGAKRRHDAVIAGIKRRRGRPRIGAGARRVQITMERSLLDSADGFARAHGLTRSELIARCLITIVARKRKSG